MWKIRVKIDNKELLFTTTEYTIDSGFISFFDRDRKRRMFAATPEVLLSVEEVPRNA